MDGPWTDIEGATSASRNPVAADIGSYLRATVTYTDSFRRADGVGRDGQRVEARTLANAAPEFDDEDGRERHRPDSCGGEREREGGNIGEPIVATDADNDVLLYDVARWTTHWHLDADREHNALFDVDRLGQISVSDRPVETDEDGRT